MHHDIISKKTKIVATIGPASASKLEGLFIAGVDVVRLNFSHGSAAEHLERLLNARAIAAKLGMPIAILQDLTGPKVRIGELATERITLEAGAQTIISTLPCLGTERKLSVNYPHLHEEVKHGGVILLNDGKLMLRIEQVSGTDIHCTVMVGGELSAHKGVNVPGALLRIGSLTQKDRADVRFGIDHQVDFIALSFVRRAQDVEELKALLAEQGADIAIIAKIETHEAIDNIDAIIASADGIMIARGDLSVEVPIEEVPVLQKMIIDKCNAAGKPVITATQMLTSMVKSPVPTRAEVNDIANAIFDGTDAIMLSEETAVGEHPIQAVQIMAKVALHTERHLPHEAIMAHPHQRRAIPASVGHSIVSTAHDINAALIVALSATGVTARLIARYRPARPIVVITDRVRTYHRMALSFNCFPILQPQSADIFSMIAQAKQELLARKYASIGQTIVIAAGIPLADPGNTNTMMVQTL